MLAEIGLSEIANIGFSIFVAVFLLTKFNKNIENLNKVLGNGTIGKLATAIDNLCKEYKKTNKEQIKYQRQQFELLKRQEIMLEEHTDILENIESKVDKID